MPASAPAERQEEACFVAVENHLTVNAFLRYLGQPLEFSVLAQMARHCLKSSWNKGRVGRLIEMIHSSCQGEASAASVTRRLVVSGAIATGAGLALRPALAGQSLSNITILASSEGGFRYIQDPGSPFSAGVAALPGHTLIRVRLRRPLPFEQGLDLVARYLTGADRRPSALAGLELRAPLVMSRADFLTFNKRYLAALRSRGFAAGQVVPVARSNMVPLFDPPAVDVISAFTYAAPSQAAEAAGGAAFLLSGRPEYDGSHVIAPGDVSPGGMSRKASFVMERLRQSVATLGGNWPDLTGMQIYMTEALQSVMDVMRTAGVANLGLSIFQGSPPVIGFDGVRYEFEADVRAIGLERVI